MDKELVKLAFKLGYQQGCQDLEKVAACASKPAKKAKKAPARKAVKKAQEAPAAPAQAVLANIGAKARNAASLVGRKATEYGNKAITFAKANPKATGTAVTGTLLALILARHLANRRRAEKQQSAQQVAQTGNL